jgi:hypothetical protein
VEARMASKRHVLLTREARTLTCEEGGGRGCW